MKPLNSNHDESKQEKRKFFSVVMNVREHCKQPVSKKFLMLVIASYCDSAGVCWPGNRLLAKVTNQSPRTVKRMVNELAAEGELEILTRGGGDQKRVIRLTRYRAMAPDMPLGGGDTAISPGWCQSYDTGVVTPLHRQTVHNSHKNSHRKKGKGSLTPLRSGRTVSDFEPRFPYPETEDEMYDTLEQHDVEPNPDYDGNFFEQMVASGWTIQGNPVWDWIATYQARLEVTGR